MVPESAVVAEILTTKKTSRKKRKPAGGVPSKELEKLKETSGLKDEVLAKCLDISVKTYRSYRAGMTLMKNTMKERVQILLNLFEHGVDVFGTSDKFREWLETENFFFDKKPPIGYLEDIKGIEFVNSRLTAMEYGANV